MKSRSAHGRLMLGLFAASALVLASCSDDGEDDPSTTTSAASGAGTTLAPGEQATLQVTSSDVSDGQQMPKIHWGPRGGGQDVSPHLSWTGAPAGTRSFVVTQFDLDARSGAGFWHWGVADIPASVTSLARGAGAENSTQLPAGAFQVKNGAGAARYVGAQPPAGTGNHRYRTTVYALDVEKAGVPRDADAPALDAFANEHALAKGSITPMAQADPAPASQ